MSSTNSLYFENPKNLCNDIIVEIRERCMLTDVDSNFTVDISFIINKCQKFINCLKSPNVQKFISAYLRKITNWHPDKCMNNFSFKLISANFDCDASIFRILINMIPVDSEGKVVKTVIDRDAMHLGVQLILNGFVAYLYALNKGSAVNE